MEFKIKGCIISFASKSGYQCKGIFYGDSSYKKTVIHIHGSYGNFYDNYFIQEMAYEYNKNRINLLAFNMETHGGFAEGFKGDTYCYVGGAVSRFESSYDDIQGAVEYVKTFSQDIILQGHSLGTDKVLYYLMKSCSKYPIILLSPCDSYELQKRWIAPETVEEQIERIKRLPETELTWLDIKEYGIKSGDENYYIPITKKAFLSLADGFNFKMTRIEVPCDEYWLDTDAFIYIGGNDAFQTSDISAVRRFWNMRLRNPQVSYYKIGDHDMSGVLDDVIKAILSWIKTIEV